MKQTNFCIKEEKDIETQEVYYYIVDENLIKEGPHNFISYDDALLELNFINEIFQLGQEDKENEILEIKTFMQSILESKEEYTLEDFSKAVYGEGPLSYEWADKPHRLIYKLTDMVKKLQENIK